MRSTPLILSIAIGFTGCEAVLFEGDRSMQLNEAKAMPAHLLTATEYNSTVQDLLGVTSRPADFFPAVSATEFDANVGVLAALSDVQAEAVFNAARDVVDEAFKSPTLTARLVTCTPMSEQDTACPRSIIEALGRRTFRRSLDVEEVDIYATAYSRARVGLGMDHVDAVAHVLRAMMSSPSFFLRIERPAEGRAFESVALASRVSYLLWGSMPDDALIAAAEQGALDDEVQLLGEVDRLLDSPNGGRFTSRFIGQWLGTVRLPSHHVDTTRFPQWTPAVASGVSLQADEFFRDFVTGDRQWRELFSAPLPVSPAVNPLTADDPSWLQRRGFLMLPAYLALSSHSDRTSPTARAKGVVTALFCTDMTPPPGVSTELPEQTGPAPTSVREQLEAHRRNPACAGCHNILDPLGLSLENFDAVGRFRSMDNGHAIDPSGTWRGTDFSDINGLIPLIERDERLASCAPRKLFGFAMRRSLTDEDEQRLLQLSTTWKAGTMRSLVHEVVRSPDFRGLVTEVP